MLNQKYNQGELKELKVKIDADIVEALKYMAENNEYSKADLVAIALKRFISHHSDYMNCAPKTDYHI